MSPSSPSASLVLSLAAALWAGGAAPPARPGPAGGSTVDFPNGDPSFHDVFCPSRAASFDLGRDAKSDGRSWTPAVPAAGR
jgi:hypothetical protein